MNLSIDKKLFGGFGAFFAAFLALALGAWVLSGRLNDRDHGSKWRCIV